MKITVETVQRIIDLAAILYSEENIRQQNSLSAEEILMASNQPDYQNLLRSIESLPQQEFAELTALMWIGRGEGDFSDWETLIEEANQKSVPGYVFEKIYLAQALRTALEKLPENFQSK